jgi:hypothetical protein
MIWELRVEVVVLSSFTEVCVFIVVVRLRRDDITGVPTPVARRTGLGGR